jgi:carbonic anhydrase
MKKFTAWVLFLVLGVMLGTMVLAGPVAAQEPIHWTYEGAEGPEHWGELSPDFALCATGTEQTPIDIPSTAPVNPADIEFNYQPTALNIFNNGHTVQVNYDPGSSIQVNGKVYDLKQFHFHTPSEHTVNSNHTALEMHLVHQSADGQLAVVGVMLNGGGDNPAYAPVFDNLPAQKSEPAAVSGVTLNADTLLPQERTYYRYNGSLTTPPCSEGVQWLLMNTPVQLADAQVSAFQQIIHENARPIQAINERSFLETSTMGTTESVATTETPAALPATGGVVFPVEGLVFGLGLLTTLTGLYLLRRKGV